MELADIKRQYGLGHRRGNTAAGIGDKVGLTLFFLMFLLMGSLFEVLIAREFLAGIHRYTWETVLCTMLESQVKETGDSDHSYARDYWRSDSYDRSVMLVQRSAPGSQQHCSMNPQRPQQAVLAQGGLWFGLVFLLPLIFMVIRWRSGRIGRPKRIVIRGRKSPMRAAAFFGVFALVGIGALIPMFIIPMSRIREARDWTPIACQILRSEVRSHQGDDSTTYSVHIQYEYEFNGQTYRADRYSFMGGSSSGHRGKRRIVDQYPVGSVAQCWVDPQRPSEAVLFRGFSPMMWAGLIPGVFILVGVGGVVATVRKRGRQVIPGTRPMERASTSLRVSHLDPDSGPVELKPRHSRMGKFVGMSVFALILNGVVAFMVMTRRPNGPASPVPLLIVVIFAGAGVASIAGVIYHFLALFNPLPHLRLSAAQVALGDRFTADWQIVGQVNRLIRLTLSLTGKEMAKYRRGTSTYTDQRIFHQTNVVTLTDRLAMQRGSTTLTIPANSMHSFQGDNNQIIWSLTLHGDILNWPDMKETFEILVTPMKAEQIAQIRSADDDGAVWGIPVEGESETP